MNEMRLLNDDQYRILFEHLAEEVHFWQIVRDETGRIKTWRLIYVNPPTLKTWGHTSLDEIAGKTPDEIFGPGATEHYLPVVEKIIAECRPHSFQDYFPNLDKYFRFTSVPYGDYFITTGADITDFVKEQASLLSDNQRLEQRVRERTAELEDSVAKLRHALEEGEGLREELRQQAIRDPLTHLFNRRFLEEFLEHEINHARRSQYKVGLIMFDVDNFKEINDGFGHEAGDTVLREIGRLALSSIRRGDVACRHGGDEFILVLPESSLTMGLQRAEELRERVRHLRWEFQGKRLAGVTLSLGVAEFPSQGDTRAELLQSVDWALYRAKQAGRDRAVSAGYERLVPGNTSRLRVSGI